MQWVQNHLSRGPLYFIVIADFLWVQHHLYSGMAVSGEFSVRAYVTLSESSPTLLVEHASESVPPPAKRRRMLEEGQWV